MYRLLVKLFVKDYKNTSSPTIRRKYGTLASFFGIISNIVICLLKIIIGMLFNFISLISDGINNLTDAGSSIISLLGFKLSNKPADSDHPFGHARIEYISGFVVSILIVVLGLQLLIQSVSSCIEHFSTPFTKINDSEFIITIIVLSISIIIKIYQGVFYKKVGKTINSLTLITTSKDSRNDVLATLGVLIGLIISHIYNFYIDGYLGIVVSLFIIYSGIILIKETSNPLIGEKVDKELIKNITDKVTSYDVVLGVHDIQIHSYGPNCYFASLHVEINAEDNIIYTHEIIDTIEKTILEEFNVHLTIHMDPILLNDPYTDEVKQKIVPEVMKLSIVKSVHDFRIVKGQNKTNVIFDIVTDSKISDGEIKSLIIKPIEELDPSYNLIITIDRE